jgi:hypothetical protein
MKKFYEVSVKYDSRLENGGAVMRVNELYLVEASSCMDAEVRITEKLTPFITDNFEIVCVKLSSFVAVIDESCFGGLPESDSSENRYFSVKMDFFMEDKKGKERCTSDLYVVFAENASNACELASRFVRDSMADCRISAVRETKIVDVIRDEGPEMMRPEL